ncbi:MAG: Gfo/Idh/MocA family oxidoreductase [Pirellulales bacterium]
MSRLKLAVIGAGHLGRIHARLLAGMEDVELVAIVDPAEEQRQEVAGKYSALALADHRQLFGRVDGAILAAPTVWHQAVGNDCLAAGLHLLIEKPLAADAAAGDSLVRMARQHGVVLQVGHVERFNPAFVAAQPYLYGAKFVQAARLGTFAGRSTDIGVVLDLMIHDIDLILSFVRSRVVQADALGLSILGKREDVAHARLVFENGAVATLEASRVSPRAERRMGVWSPSGFASLDFAARTASLIRPCDRVKSHQYDVDELSAAERLCVKDRLFEELLPVEPLAIEPQDPLTAELTDFVSAIRRARAPRVTGEQGREALSVAELVLDSIERHAWEGHPAGLRGPQLTPGESVIPAPHFLSRPATVSTPWREAG